MKDQLDNFQCEKFWNNEFLQEKISNFARLHEDKDNRIIIFMVDFKDIYEPFASWNNNHKCLLQSVTFLRRDISTYADENTFHLYLDIKKDSIEVDSYFYN